MTDPVTYWNREGSWSDTFKGVRTFEVGDGQIFYKVKGKPLELCVLTDTMLTIQSLKLTLTRFEALVRFRFKGNYRAAMSEVEFFHLNADIPYIRVGTDYFKIIRKRDRYEVDRDVIKGWKKEEIKQDHGSDIITSIPRFDDFCIVPDNKSYSLIHNNCFNLYAQFSHTPYNRPVHESQIPVTMGLLRHVFGDQISQGLTYLKILYEYPKQILPILTLISKERSTGKTTFLNWIAIIFGDNFVLINPSDLESSFNSGYATKNIIAIEETLIDKVQAGEKLKSITTGKLISVNQKHVAHYTIPFFGKAILCSNKERDFMRIDDEEIRFWIRKLRPIDNINTSIEDQLTAEIPMFLRYLEDLPQPDFTRSRMVFTPSEIGNEYLDAVKQESYSGLRKELMILIEQHFNDNTGLDQFQASSMDIKATWFAHNNQITNHYIGKVLRDEMKLGNTLEWYNPMGTGDPANKKSGRCYTFERAKYASVSVRKPQKEAEIPF